MKNFKDCNKAAEKPDAVRPKRDDDPNWLIVKWLSEWVSKRGTALPQPCPTDFLACANWWRNHMQPKRLKDDQVLLASSRARSRASNAGCSRSGGRGKCIALAISVAVVPAAPA